MIERYTVIVISGGNSGYYYLETDNITRAVAETTQFNTCDVVYILKGWQEPETYTPKKKAA